MSFYFYDVETSGLSPKWQRIMQFAGVRTDDDFNEIDEPDNWLVKLTPEILPDPEAIMVTGITPQQTLADGYSEPEFVELLSSKVFTPGTTALGFNTIRFDDEFVRYVLYRNFRDPYRREWADNRSRWDIVDLVRMTRALRPEGVEWPVNSEGEPTNRLEKLTKANNISHDDAHDALSDVRATIAVAKLIKKKQPKLFTHVLSLKDKRSMKKFLEENEGKPFVHSSSMFHSKTLSTSVVIVLATDPSNPNAVLVYDLRHSPKKFDGLSVEELAKRAFTQRDQLQADGLDRLPVKGLHINKSPAVAPIGVLDEASQERISLTLDQVKAHLAELKSMPQFADLVEQAWKTNSFDPEVDADAQLYDSFIDDADRRRADDVASKTSSQLADWDPGFDDERLAELLLRYKAKHFPDSLSAGEKQQWEAYRAKRLNGSIGPAGMQAYMNKLEKMYQKADEDKRFLLEELKLYAESIAPYETEELL